MVFPMVNPDGVYLGNSRCNYNGVDLNRYYTINNIYEEMGHNGQLIGSRSCTS